MLMKRMRFGGTTLLVSMPSTFPLVGLSHYDSLVLVTKTSDRSNTCTSLSGVLKSFKNIGLVTKHDCDSSHTDSLLTIFPWCFTLVDEDPPDGQNVTENFPLRKSLLSPGFAS